MFEPLAKYFTFDPLELSSIGLKKLNLFGWKENSLANVPSMLSAKTPMVPNSVNVKMGSLVMVFNAQISMNVKIQRHQRVMEALPK